LTDGFRALRIGSPSNKKPRVCGAFAVAVSVVGREACRNGAGPRWAGAWQAFAICRCSMGASTSYGVRWTFLDATVISRQICVLDAACNQVNNPHVAANSATGLGSPNRRRTQRRTESRRFFMPDFRAVPSADFWRRCVGSRKARRSYAGLPTRAPFATLSPFRVATPRKGSCPWKFGMCFATPGGVPVALSALAALFRRSGGVRHDSSRFVLSATPRHCVS
jgi:hypothetical protein